MKSLMIHQPCESCGSSDAMTINDDGSTKCYSCGKFTPKKRESMRDSTIELLDPHISGLPSHAYDDRGISEDVVKEYGGKAEFSESTGEITKHYYPYYKDGSLSGYKVRVIDGKVFYSKGVLKNVELFGQHLFTGRRMIIVTEGELDAMSARQMLKDCDKDYGVVSLVHGAGLSGLKENMEFLNTFETVMLDFDEDKAGKEALDKAVGFFEPGKVKVISHKKYKDANEMLMDGKSKQYLKDVMNAKVYKPDGIIDLSGAWDVLFEDSKVKSVPYPWEGLNDKLYGLREREIVTITGGSGTGKSALTREIEHWLLNNTEDNIGVLALEESVARTGWGIMAIEADRPLAIKEEREGISDEDIKGWFDKTLGTGRYFTFDHFGSTDEDNLISKVGYMVRVLGCKWIILDHLSIVVSAMDQGLDERRTIDSVMTKLRQLTEETGAGLILVSHLKRTTHERGHENGLEVSLSHLRGSQSIAQLSDAVIAAERDQQADNERVANTLTIRVLKNRYAGLVGGACKLYYDRETGRLVEEAFVPLKEDEEF